MGNKTRTIHMLNKFKTQRFVLERLKKGLGQYSMDKHGITLEYA